jgi:hypothetical protein
VAAHQDQRARRVGGASHAHRELVFGAKVPSRGAVRRRS